MIIEASEMIGGGGGCYTSARQQTHTTNFPIVLTYNLQSWILVAISAILACSFFSLGFVFLLSPCSVVCAVDLSR